MKKENAEHASNGQGLCVRWGFPTLKLNSSNNFKIKTNV